MKVELSEAATALLVRLTSFGGDDQVGIASVYPGINAFTEHAIAYFHNAALLCKRIEAPDFAVFGALYCIRHGLELWLKCIVQNDIIDEVLEAIAEGKAFEAILTAARCRDPGEKQERFIKAICVMRNAEAGLEPPQVGEVEVARKRLASGGISRHRLSLVWPVPLWGHDLGDLWEKAARSIRLVYDDVRTLSLTEIGEPMLPDEVQAACELLAVLDKGGDTFRYPCSLAGEWNLQLPGWNLGQLRELAEGLDITVRAYDLYFEESTAAASIARMGGGYRELLERQRRGELTPED
ncbi:MAG TPA: hypothetical protein VJU61_10830 [Polyangiaceae bacterium]|nr:hypothetical protein [Polyangiaceae bacterium]